MFFVGVGVLTACSATPSPPIVSSPAGTVASPAGTVAAPTASGDGALVDEPPGSLTCGELKTAVNGATLMEPGVVDGIVRISSTADAPVADSARRLAVAYASAVAAHGSEGEPDAIAAVSMAGAEMTQVCVDSGLDTVG